MRATDLQQMLRVFDPGRPLQGEEELSSWFVERPGSPRQRLRLLLESDETPRKILFAGHPGSGKSTEIAKLAGELAPTFQMIDIDLVTSAGSSGLTSVGLLLAFTEQLVKKISELKLASADTADEVLRSIGSQLDMVTRQTTDFNFGRQLPRQLMDALNQLVTGFDLSPRPLLLIEGLDKVAPETARDLLVDFAPMSDTLEISMLIVIPAALRHYDEFQRIREGFSDFQLLPNWSIYHRNGQRDVSSLDPLTELIRARAKAHLVVEVGEFLQRMSGGVPKQLVSLVRNAALHALARNTHRVSIRDAEDAVSELRRDLAASLDYEDQDLLRARHADRRITAGSREIRLLSQGSLIEYADDIPWCDAHPALWPMLEEETQRGFELRQIASEYRVAPATPADVYIKTVELQDVKGIRQARLELAETAAEAPGWYVFAGGNGSGKSTLLRSLALSMPGTWSSKLIDPSWVRNDAKGASVKVTLLSAEAEEELVSSLEIRRDGEVESNMDEATEDLLHQAWFVAGYGPFKRLEGGSNLAQGLAQSNSHLGRVVTLFLEEAWLSEVPTWLLYTGFQRRSLTRSILDLLNSGLLPEGFRAEKVVSQELILATPDGPAMPLRHTSDGPRSMVAMVLDILRALEDCHGTLRIEDQQVLHPGVVLIDEPDNHLHIHWQLKLGSWLKQHFPKIQFIVATHSPFLCAAADRIWRLDDEEGHIAPRALSDEEMRQVQVGSVTTILESDAFRIFNTLPMEARERHEEFLRLRRQSLQGKKLSPEERTLLDELEQEFFGPGAPRDPEFEALFP